jgi:hypothetical protein
MVAVPYLFGRWLMVIRRFTGRNGQKLSEEPGKLYPPGKNYMLFSEFGREIVIV